MPERAQSSRRRHAAALLGSAACAGILLMAFADKGSSWYELGSMLLLGCVTIGTFVVLYFAKKRAPVLDKPPSFAPGTPFVAHLSVTVAAPGAGGAVFNRDRYFLLLGTEGFSARFRGQPSTQDVFDVQLLLPGEALARFPAGTAFRVFDGKHIVAQGSVLGCVAETERA